MFVFPAGNKTRDIAKNGNVAKFGNIALPAG